MGSGKPLEEKKAELAAIAAKQGVDVPAVKVFKPFKIGAKGPSVQKVQEGLGINADGQFGPGTEAAVKAFQKKESLPINGIVDEETYRRIQMK